MRAGGRPAHTIHAAAGRAGDLRPLQGHRRTIRRHRMGISVRIANALTCRCGRVRPRGPRQQRRGLSFGAWTYTPPNGDIQTRHAAKSRGLAWLSSIEGITLSDREGQGEHTPCRRSARLAGRRRSPLEACRSGALCEPGVAPDLADERAGVRGLLVPAMLGATANPVLRAAHLADCRVSSSTSERAPCADDSARYARR